MAAEERIGDRTFKVSPLPAVQTTRMAARLAKVIGPTMASLFQPGADAEADAGKMAQAMATFTGGMDPDELTTLIVDLCQMAEVDEGAGYRKVDYDVAFQGRMADVPNVLAIVIREHFSDFFSGFRAAGGLGTKAG